MQATVAQAVSGTLGRAVGLEEPLMTAGLDSLGTFNFLWQTFHSGSSQPGAGPDRHALPDADCKTALLEVCQEGSTPGGDDLQPQVLCFQLFL